MTTITSRKEVPVNQRFAAWLTDEKGRAAHFSKVDPYLTPPMITKLKKGATVMTFEIALRIERAQKPGHDPLKAEELVAFKEDLELLDFVRGRAPAPQKPVPKPAPATPKVPRPKRPSTRKPKASTEQ